MSALHTQLWLNTIEEKLRPNWNILTRLAKNDNINLHYFGINRKVIIPNAGADPVVSINSTTFPQTGTTRTDTAVEYNVDAFRTKPTIVRREDALSVSYDKIASVVESHFGSLGEVGMYNTFAKWIDAGQEKSGIAGTTFKVEDVIAAKKVLDKQKVPMIGRVLLLNAEHANDLLKSLVKDDSNIAFIDNDGMSILNRPFYGFEVVQMPAVIEFASGTTTPVAYGDLGATGNIPVSLAYHKDMVSVAKADTHIYYNEGNATEFGDIMSAEAYFGGKARRTDLKGVVQIFKA